MAKTLDNGDRVFGENGDGVFFQFRSCQSILSSVRVRGDALCGFGAVVFFDELQVDVGGGAIAVIEFAASDDAMRSC